MAAQYVAVKFDAQSGAPEGRTYTYMWDDSLCKLAVGDRVCVPPSWANPDPSLATVVDVSPFKHALTSFKGELKQILSYLDDDGRLVNANGEEMD
jgi:hypothetical protein